MIMAVECCISVNFCLVISLIFKFVVEMQLLKYNLIVQLKHNLEQEVENMEDEIDRLKAQLAEDSDFEETKMSDAENVAEDNALCEKTVFMADGSQQNLPNLEQKFVTEDKQKTDILQEPLPNTLELNSENGRSLQHETDRNKPQDYAELAAKPCCVMSDAPSLHDDAMFSTPCSTASKATTCNENAQQAVASSIVKDVLATSETEEWPELSANTVMMLCEPMTLSHDITDRQSVSDSTSMVDDGGKPTTANFDYGERPADTLTDTATRGVPCVVRDHSSNVSPVSLAAVSEHELMVNGSCIRSGNAGGLDQESVCAVPDSLDEIPVACGGADDEEEDETSSVASYEDIVIPDSEDDLFYSPNNGDIDYAALTSHLDESKHIDIAVEVSSSVSEECGKVVGSTKPVNVSDAHSSETVHYVSVGGLAGSGKNAQCRSEDNCRTVNHIDVSQRSNECMPDADNADVKHKVSMVEDCMIVESHSSGTDETIDAAIEQNQQPTTLHVVHEQFSKRPHWTVVVSGISQELDQVIGALQLIGSVY